VDERIVTPSAVPPSPAPFCYRTFAACAPARLATHALPSSFSSFAALPACPAGSAQRFIQLCLLLFLPVHRLLLSALLVLQLQLVAAAIQVTAANTAVGDPRTVAAVDPLPKCPRDLDGSLV
jgi:hypothetical protein